MVVLVELDYNYRGVRKEVQHSVGPPAPHLDGMARRTKPSRRCLDIVHFEADVPKIAVRRLGILVVEKLQKRASAGGQKCAIELTGGVAEFVDDLAVQHRLMNSNVRGRSGCQSETCDRRLSMRSSRSRPHRPRAREKLQLRHGSANCPPGLLEAGVLLHDRLGVAPRQNHHQSRLAVVQRIGLQDGNIEIGTDDRLGQRIVVGDEVEHHAETELLQQRDGADRRAVARDLSGPWRRWLGQDDLPGSFEWDRRRAARKGLV